MSRAAGMKGCTLLVLLLGLCAGLGRWIPGPKGSSEVRRLARVVFPGGIALGMDRDQIYRLTGLMPVGLSGKYALPEGELTVYPVFAPATEIMGPACYTDNGELLFRTGSVISLRHLEGILGRVAVYRWASQRVGNGLVGHLFGHEHPELFFGLFSLSDGDLELYFDSVEGPWDREQLLDRQLRIQRILLRRRKEVTHASPTPANGSPNQPAGGPSGLHSSPGLPAGTPRGGSASRSRAGNRE